jgi:hypothetical protein
MLVWCTQKMQANIPFDKRSCGFPSFLVITSAVGNKEDLTCRMCMPVVPSPRLKMDIADSVASRFILRNEDVQPCGPGKIIGRGFFTIRENYILIF